MRKIASRLMGNMPLISTIIALSLLAAVAKADYVSCGDEQSSGSTGYPEAYESPTYPWCNNLPATVFAFKDCTDQNGNACTISWNENYLVLYSYDSGYCYARGGIWVSNTNIVNTCQ